MAHSNGAILVATLRHLGEPVTKEQFFKVISRALKLPFSAIEATLEEDLSEGVKWGYIEEACCKYSLYDVDLNQLRRQKLAQLKTLPDVKNLDKKSK